MDIQRKSIDRTVTLDDFLKSIMYGHFETAITLFETSPIEEIRRQCLRRFKQSNCLEESQIPRVENCIKDMLSFKPLIDPMWEDLLSWYVSVYKTGLDEFSSKHHSIGFAISLIAGQEKYYAGPVSKIITRRLINDCDRRNPYLLVPSLETFLLGSLNRIRGVSWEGEEPLMVDKFYYKEDDWNIAERALRIIIFCPQYSINFLPIINRLIEAHKGGTISILSDRTKFINLRPLPVLYEVKKVLIQEKFAVK